MPKTTTTYWNPLDTKNKKQWQAIPGFEGLVEELTLSINESTGEYTRLTRFLPGADTTAFGGKSHAYPKEVFIVSGRLYDQAFDMWLVTRSLCQQTTRRSTWPFQNRYGLHCVRSLFSKQNSLLNQNPQTVSSRK